MRYPEFLKDGGTIGFIAPSFGCSIQPYKDRFDAAQKRFLEMGYSVSLGPNCYENSGVGISNTPEKCANELMDFYESGDNDILISCGGGELMCETISEVDFVRINASKPKWFMGYSDNTNFSFLLATMADTASVYGPNAPAFGMAKWHESLTDSFDVLTGKNLKAHNYDKFQIESLIDEEHPYESYNCTVETKIFGFVPEGEFTEKRNVVEKGLIYEGDETASNCGFKQENNIFVKGRLLGGCLDVLAGLVGTRFDYVSKFNEKYKDDGVIWFLEACELGVLDIRRALWSMKEAGWFDNAKAFIFGRPLNGGENMGLNYVDAVMEHTLKAFNVPVITDADIGHVAPSMPVINGALSEVSLIDGNLVIDMGIEL